MNCVKAESNIFAASSFPVLRAKPAAAQEDTSRYAWCIMTPIEGEREKERERERERESKD